MAIAPVHPAPPLAAADAVRQVHDVLDRVGPVEELDGYAASHLLGDVQRARTRLEAMELALVATVDKSQVATDAGMTGTAAWLAARARRDTASAAREVELAAALDDGLAATREALGDGELTTEHARVIATATAQLPDGLAESERTAIEESLVSVAKRVDPTALRRKARRALESAQRSQAEVDAHEDAVLRGEEERALAATRLTLHDNHDGTTTGHFTVPTLAATILKKVVQQMASPRRFAQQAARRARAEASASGATLTADQVAEATWDAFRAEELDWSHLDSSQTDGRAFVELLEHLPTDHLSGKVNATVLVTVEHDKLKASLGAAHLDSGHDLSASEARRLACGAGVLPGVLGGESQVLDLGRTNRFFSEAQRVALVTKYDMCAADDCDRPYAWTELHHEDPWATGGRTDLELAVPLCGFHHRRLHQPGFRHRITREPNGRKHVTIQRRT